MRLIRSLVSLSLAGFLLLQPLPAFAGTWGVVGQRVTFEGVIEPGDAEKFALLLQEGAHAPRYVELRSGGGSLDAAAKIASLIELFRLRTNVPKKATFASACFVVFLAGSARTPYRDFDDANDGRVGLHRPYIKAAPTASTSGYVPVDMAKQRAAMANLRRYLGERNVPQRLIDEMMARPSNDIYWITSADLVELGNVGPETEELYIANCGYRRDFVVFSLKAGMSLAQVEEAEAKMMERELALDKRLRTTERPELIKRMRAGWRPWS